MSNRSKIVNSIVSLVNINLNGITYSSNIYRNAENKLKFWDEINQYPYISMTAGPETREYLPANQKWGFLGVTIRVYVRQEDSSLAIEQFMEDIEDLLDSNNELEFDTNKTIQDIRIISIDTDEGLLDPLGVGEIQLQIRYAL